MSVLAIASTEIFVDAWCQQDSHVKAFRWYWHSRGVDVRRNGVYSLRGVRQLGKSFEQVAKEYGR